MTAAERVAGLFVRQAQACESLGSAMYSSLLRRCAEDIRAGGPVATVVRGHEDDPEESVLPLRLLGAVHRLVLEGELPGLAAHYPSVGGDGDAAAAWPALRAALDQRAAQLRPLLDTAPQTNEVGRAAGLVGGLLHVADAFGLPVELHEMGSSAGLNLQFDRFCYTDEADRLLWGEEGSRVRLTGAWQGALPPVTAPLRVVGRHGSDLAPLDPRSASDCVTLLAYVWPDMTLRLERLRAALEIARRHPVPVDRLDAVAAAERLELVQGRTVVLWHSVMWQYIGADSQAAVTARLDHLGAGADASSPLAHLFLEPVRRAPGGEPDFLVVLDSWPGGSRVLGTARGHGPPVVWE